MDVEVHPVVWEADRDTIIEAPPGFKWLAMHIAEKTGASVSGRPVWGSCDVRVDYGYRRVFHLGHEVPPNVGYLLRKNLAPVEKIDTDLYRMYVRGVEVLFIPVYYKPPPSLPTPREFGKIFFPLPYRKIAEEISRRTGYPLVYRPITGCWVGESPTELAYVVATGVFYPLTLKFFWPNARVYQVDPFRGVVRDVESDFARVMKLKARPHLTTPKKVAVLVSTKAGQLQLEKAKALNQPVVILDEITPEYIDDLGVDLVINTACPRIGIDDLDRVRTPVMNYYEYLARELDPLQIIRF